MAKATHVVTHKRLYLAVKGKLTHFPPGKQLTLTDKQAEKMAGRVSPLKDGETVDLTGAADKAAADKAAADKAAADKAAADKAAADKAAADKAAVLASLKARAVELNIKDAHKFGEKRLSEEIEKAETAIAAGNKAVNS